MLLKTQRRFAEHGRIRLGEKGPKGEPRKLTTFRLTSHSRAALEAAAKLYGGVVHAWEGSPSDGAYELLTTSTELDVWIPPIPGAVSQYMELWDKGGCKRRCDEVTELLSGGPCLCDPDARECKVTTRISVMLPRLSGLGLWRLDSHGWNAATTLPGIVESMAGTGKFIPAILRAEQRTEKKDGQTRKFVVPVIDLPQMTLGALMESAAPHMLLGGVVPTPRNVKVERPELAPPIEPPAENPAWKGENVSTVGQVDQFQGMMDALDQIPKAGVDDWVRANKDVVAKLLPGQQKLIKETVAAIRKHPF